MNRIVCFVILFFSLIIDLKAQYIPLDERRHLDSLNRIINSHVGDSIKARAKFSLSYHWADTDTLKSWQYLSQAKLLSKNNAYLQSLGYYFTGCYFWTRKPVLAKSMFLRANALLSRFHRKEAYQFRARGWGSYASILQREDKEKENLDIVLNKCIPLAEKSGDMGLVGNHNMNVGLILNNTLQYNKAEEYYLKAIKLLKPSTYTSTLADAYMLSASNYIVLKKTALAKAMLDDAKKLLLPFPNSIFSIDYYHYEGNYFELIKDYNKAQKSFDSGIELAKNNNKLYEVERLMFRKYKTYTKQKQYEKAKEMLLYIMQNPTDQKVSNRLLHYYELGETYNRLGRFSNAYKWSNQALVLLDSVYDARMKTDIFELEIKYQAAEKQKKIALLNAEKKTSDTFIKKQPT